MARSEKRKSPVDVTAPSKKVRASKSIMKKQDRDQKPSTLLSIPAELRNEIFSLVLAEDRTIEVPRRSKSKIGRWSEPGILTVCKQTRSEAIQMYYAINHFNITLKMPEFQQASKWIASVVRSCGLKPFDCLSILVRGRVVAEIHHFRHFVQLIRQVDTELSVELPELLSSARELSEDIGGYREWYANLLKTSVLHVQQMFEGLTVEGVVREVIALGQEGYKQGWSEPEMDKKFSEWLAVKQSTLEVRNAIRYQQLRLERVASNGLGSV